MLKKNFLKEKLHAGYPVLGTWATVPSVLLLMSDGKPNISTTADPNFCRQAWIAANVAKAQGIEVFTVGFGLDVEERGR